MNVPNLPTDNLYKFIALSGLALVVSGAALPLLMVENLHREYTEKLDKTNEILREMQLSIRPDADGKIRPTLEVERAAGLMMAEADNLSRWFGQRQEILEEREKILRIMFWAGIVIGLLGLWLWYHRVQKIQDEILRLDAAKARKNAS